MVVKVLGMGSTDLNKTAKLTLSGVITFLFYFDIILINFSNKG